jgi:uncharacterized protein (DUF58 family)
LPAREAELYVFPAIQPFNETLEALQLEAGRLTANKRGLGQDLLALRDYQPNDDFRRIDWKATARSRNLTVREFSADDDKRVVIFFDNQIPAESGPVLSLREKIEAEQGGKPVAVSERFERGVSLATSIIAHFTEEQAEICLIVGPESGEFGVGSHHLHAMLQRLAVVEPQFSTNGEPESLFTRILNESDSVFYFVVSAAGSVRWPSERPQQVKLIRF